LNRGVSDVPNDSLEELFEGEKDLWQKIEHATIVDLLNSRGVIAYVNTRAMNLDSLENFSEMILPSSAS
jgi:hypothetical protein